MQEHVADQRKTPKKNIKLVCVFSPKSSDANEIKKDVNSILKVELRRQMHGQNH